MIEVIAQIWLGFLGIFGEIATILGDVLLGVVGFWGFLSLL
jgi:hypothetical protein